MTIHTHNTFTEAGIRSCMTETDVEIADYQSYGHTVPVGDKTLVVNVPASDEVISTLMARGAKGVMLVGEDISTLKTAINTIEKKGLHYKGIAAEVIVRTRFTKHRPVSLTRREREVYDLLMQGLISLEISDKLCISKRTVDVHISNIFAKAGVSNRMRLLVERPF